MSTKIDEKKALIQKAASVCFAKYGYSKTTLEDIAHSIGMKKSSLYYYFPNKETLFISTFSKEWQSKLLQIQAKVDNKVHGLERIKQYSLESANFFNNVVEASKISVQLILETRKSFPEFFGEILKIDSRFYTKIIEEAIDKGEVKKCNPAKIAQIIITVSEAIKNNAFEQSEKIDGKKVEFNELGKDVVYTLDLILDGLKNK